MAESITQQNSAQLRSRMRVTMGMCVTIAWVFIKFWCFFFVSLRILHKHSLVNWWNSLRKKHSFLLSRSNSYFSELDTFLTVSQTALHTYTLHIGIFSYAAHVFRVLRFDDGNWVYLRWPIFARRENLSQCRFSNWIKQDNNEKTLE